MTIEEAAPPAEYAPTTTDYEVVIGLETHVQLLTQSKMFCNCSSDYAAAPPNTHVCPICLGMPGTLPTINARAIEITVMTGLALNTQIPPYAKFDRKNYFYPDIPKGYQISQYDMPLTANGVVEVEVNGGTTRVGITRAHLEEDTAKLTHVAEPNGQTYSLVDFNRAGVPLLEIVTEPDMRNADEAMAYVTKLRQILRYIGASTGNMEEGAMRCDVNISLRPRGAAEFGTKVELKNLNSISNVGRAIAYEIERQTHELTAEHVIPQETRGWDDLKGITVSQRSKEFAHDYRYFPEPDLPPLELGSDFVERMRARLPELPDARRRRFIDTFSLSAADATQLTASRETADYFERVVGTNPPQGRAKSAANWIVNDLFARLHGTPLSESKVTPVLLSKLLDLLENGTITGKGAKTVFEGMWAAGADPETVVRERGLAQISDPAVIMPMVEAAMTANPQSVADYRKGKTNAIQRLIGAVMGASKGAANQDIVRGLLEERLNQQDAPSPASESDLQS